MIIKRYNSIKSLAKAALMVMCLTAFVSCKDDDFGAKGGFGSSDDDGEQLILPIGISFGSSTRTRAEEDYPHGGDSEHKVDFSENESFAIFFDKKGRVQCLKPLLTNEELGSGSAPSPSGNEYGITVLANVPRKYVERGSSEENGVDWEPIHYIMVVLNGGVIYTSLNNEVTHLIAQHTDDDIEHISNLIWSNPAKYSTDEPNTNEDAYPNQPPIGFNTKGLFTMTSASYWKWERKVVGEDDDDEEKEGEGSDTGGEDGDEAEPGAGNKPVEYEDKYTLMTAAPIEGDFYVSLEEFIKNGKNPSTIVYVERMVSKFSPPTFSTQVIGSDRVFRPDQYALDMLFHKWEGDKYKVERRNWRVHLMGWSINGYESSNYIFKKIGNHPDGDEWWNDPSRHRSYWSLDPHYNKVEDQYYPWQIRKAADMDKIISIDYGMLAEGARYVPVLRYKSFNQINSESKSEDDSWNYQDIYMHENTYEPGDEWDLDGRPEQLAGPHLLVTAELYIEGIDGNYEVGGVPFGKVGDLYSDNNHRYYLEEKDWFKMFVYDLNNYFHSQEKMGFTELNWGKEFDKKNERFTVWTPGDCRLFYDGQLLTNDLIDELYEKNKEKYQDSENEEDGKNLLEDAKYLFKKSKANVRNGDGRLVPWLEKGLLDPNGKGLEIRQPLVIDGEVQYDKDENVIYDTKPLSYFTEADRTYVDKDGKTVIRKDEDMPTKNDWNENFYKSFFYEWFGPIDHYYKGYMYYSGAITHYELPSGKRFYGIVRNHWYRFNIESINGPGIPVDDPDQLIIPERHAYRNEIATYPEVIDWHPKDTEIDFQ